MGWRCSECFVGLEYLKYPYSHSCTVNSPVPWGIWVVIGNLKSLKIPRICVPLALCFLLGSVVKLHRSFWLELLSDQTRIIKSSCGPSTQEDFEHLYNVRWGMVSVKEILWWDSVFLSTYTSHLLIFGDSPDIHGHKQTCETRQRSFDKCSVMVLYLSRLRHLSQTKAWTHVQYTPEDYYCWWKKSCTAWDVWNPVNNEINYISTG